MALAITTEQEQLADAVTKFAARHAPLDKTRAAFDSIAAGELPSWWEEFTAHGFAAVHIQEESGGQGGTLADMACVVEAAAAALLPGPLLSTATAGAVAALAGPAAAPLLTDLAAGATAAVVLPEHSTVHAVHDGDSWRLNGSTGTTLGICAAQRILVAAHAGEGADLWFVLDAGSGSGLSVEQQRGTDLSTDVGVLHLADHRVPASAVLSEIPTERARCVVVALAACASAGAVRRGVEMAVDYIRTREQFGKPVGSFQALQHKAAVLLVNNYRDLAGDLRAGRRTLAALLGAEGARRAFALLVLLPIPTLILIAASGAPGAILGLVGAPALAPLVWRFGRAEGGPALNALLVDTARAGTRTGLLAAAGIEFVSSL